MYGYFLFMFKRLKFFVYGGTSFWLLPYWLLKRFLVQVVGFCCIREKV